MMIMGKKILIIDDDSKLQDLLKNYLRGYGYMVIGRPEGNHIADVMAKEKPDIVLLDIMLPGVDGLEILREIRSRDETPVIMLTAKGDDADRIVGLELGADDYLPKPFNPRELLARLKAVLRRSGGKRASHQPGASEPVLAAGFLLNPALMTLEKNGSFEELSQTEFKLLEALMTHANTAISRDELMNLARGRDFIAFERSIDVHISHLRAKIEKLSGRRELIKTVWGKGYMFVDQP